MTSVAKKATEIFPTIRLYAKAKARNQREKLRNEFKTLKIEDFPSQLFIRPPRAPLYVIFLIMYSVCEKINEIRLIRRALLGLFDICFHYFRGF